MCLRCFFLRGFLAAVLVATALSAISVSSATYTVGVTVGDWVKYAIVGAVPYLSEYEWVRYEIKNVKGTNVTFELIIHFKDEGENIDYDRWDIATGSTPWIIPAVLTSDDAFPFHSATATVNATLPRIYGGASRTVHLLNLSAYDDYTTLVGYWDQATGFLLDLVLTYASPTSHWTGGYRLLETNLWSPVLAVTMELSSDMVISGETVTVSAVVKDLSGTRIEGATVLATIGPTTVTLTDEGRGKYEGVLDTYDIDAGDHLVTVTAEKDPSVSVQSTLPLTVQAGIPWMLYLGVAAMALLVSAVMWFAFKRR